MAVTQGVGYFLGANSPLGFFSLYDQLIDLETAARVYILKGGPGCGKSTLMRQVAADVEASGKRAEYILCSGDPDSLDGVIFPELGVAIVDGTAPHGRETESTGKERGGGIVGEKTGILFLELSTIPGPQNWFQFLN